MGGLEATDLLQYIQLLSSTRLRLKATQFLIHSASHNHYSISMIKSDYPQDIIRCSILRFNIIHR